MSHRFALALGQTSLAIVGLGLAGCAVSDVTATTAQDVHGGAGSAVGLAVEVDNGNGIPLQLKKGQTFYFNQIDMRASLDTDHDEGVSGLASSSDFASLHWGGVYFVEQEPVLLGNADGTYTMRRFYRGASWMNQASEFTLEQIDEHGHRIGKSVHVTTGLDHDWKDSDSFFIRRFRAIQWINDCRALHDCTGATSFQEEGLVELRNALHPEDTTFNLNPHTTALRLTWSLRPYHPYTIPVTQVEDPQWGYGFNIAIDTLTPPNANGTYAPGQDITFKMTLEDGEGNPLAPPGDLPSYNDVIFGPNPSGIQYYRAFFDPTTTYWRRKHRERNMMATFEGPLQDMQPMRSVIPLDAFLAPGDVQEIASMSQDGVFAEFKTFPTARDLFGGALDPTHAGWANPVPDTWTHHLPADAPPGTYDLTVKGRRTYMGQDIPFTRTVQIEVGTKTPTHETLNTGGCSTCHSGQSSLADVLHANADRSSCAGCHAPLGIELEGPIYVRTHFLHSRSNRFPAALDNCSTCHLTRQSIQRVSKSACLSCHRSYNAWHVQQFGPVESIYVGGSTDSFQQCTTACHTNHPNSQL